MKRAVCLLFGSVFLVIICRAQTPNSDPQALAYAQQALAALTSGNVPSDVTLQGNVAENFGGETVTGTATFEAKGYGESLYNSQASQRQILRGFDSSGNPAGSWTDSSGNAHPIAVHNLFTDASWFFPAFSSLNVTQNSQIVASYMGPETRYGASVEHLQFEQYLLNQPDSVVGFVWGMSQEDIYLDASSLLPLGMTFNIHPSDNALANITIEVVFSNYQNINGILVPFHVQRFMNGNLVIDFAATSAVLNSGLQDSSFTVQ